VTSRKTHPATAHQLLALPATVASDADAAASPDTLTALAA
jgi:hypothetical protein